MAAFVLVSASTVHGAGGLPFYKCSGRQILSTNGSAFLIKGQALNGWLTPEAYQLKLNQVYYRHFGSASSIQTNILNILATNAADAQAFWDTYRSNYVAQTDLSIFKTQGFNVVRVPFNYRLLQPVTGQWDNAGFQVLSNVVSWCKANDLAVILDMHCAPGGQSADAPSDPEYTYWAQDTNLIWLEHGVACLWETNAAYTALTGRTPVYNRQRTVDIWKEIATRFKSEPQIIGYELLNEPFLPAGVNYPILRELYTNTTAAIRSVDTNHIIFIEGNYYSGTFEGMTPAWDTNLAYIFHRYWTTATTANVQGFIDVSVSNNVPIVMGETGENSNPWFYRFKNVLESNSIGWCWWGWKKVDSIPAAYSAYITPDYQYVIDNFRDSNVDSARVKKGLMEMATNLTTALCRYEQGYFPSLRDPNFDVFRKPFASLTSPGFVPAAEYDVGDDGTAYHDTRIMQEDGVGGTGGNAGWNYRNDGVDIYATTGGLWNGYGDGYKVGNIAASEYLRYTVVAVATTSCDIVARVASPTNTGKFRIKLNGVNLTATLSVPTTGASDLFTNIDGGVFTIPKGTNLIEVNITGGGYDFAGLWFNPTNHITQNLGYYNNPATNPAVEHVPGTNGFGSFFQVNYATTTTTFFVLGADPSICPRNDETGQVAIKVSYFSPVSNAWYDLFTPMSNVATVVLGTNSTFHGLPVSGAATVDVYRFDWDQPRDLTGQPLTTNITVYYAPFFRTLAGTTETARLYLAQQGGQSTNSYPVLPQQFAPSFLNTDYSYNNQFPVAAASPTCSPNGGTYTGSVNVTLSSATAGSTIYYTSDGSAPATNSPSATNNAIITLTQPYSNSVKSFAAATGYVNSAISTSAVFVVVPMPSAAAPSYSPNGGAYTSSVNVTLTSATAGSMIYYTTDGSAPATNSPSATNNAIITLTQPYSNNVRSFAKASGYQNSAISTSSVFTVVAMPIAAAPSYAPNGGTYTNSVNVTLSSATAGSTIYYTTDGSAPATNSPSVTNNALVTLTQPFSNSVKSFSAASGFQNSAISTSAAISVAAPPVATSPTYAPNGGAYTSSVNVTLSSATAGSTIYYTTDGSAPATNSPSVTNNAIIALTQPYSNNVRSFAKSSGFQNSAISTSAVFTVVPVPAASAPTCSPNGGTYTNAVNVTLSSATAGSTIYYTTDGSPPATNSPSVTNNGIITLFEPYTNGVRSFAAAAGYQSSTTATSLVFSIVAMPFAAAPSCAPNGGTYTDSVDVTLSSATAGSTIYYTTDGTAPATNSLSVTNSGIITLVQPYTNSVRSFARVSGYQDSAISTGAVFTVVPMPTAASPSYSPDGGAYTGAVNVTLSSATAGSTIYYTTDGSTPSTNSLSVTNNGIVTLSQPYANSVMSFASASGYQDSSISTSAPISVVAAGPDSDGDGMNDAWEMAQFGSLDQGATNDPDGDGVDNLDEYIADTQPTNSASFLQQSINSADALTTILSINPSSTGRVYSAWSKADLVDPAPWTSCGVLLPGNGGVLLLTVTNATVVGHFSIRVALP